jgi:ribosomal protein S18 acetylase RimI-like enzyme
MKGFFKKKNPFWSHAECTLFIARKNNEVIGRIAAIIDSTYCETVAEKIGFFGFFECTDDYECAQALLTTAQEWLTTKQMNKMRGPIDGRIDVGCGLLYTGFDSRPSLLSTYTPAYYVSYAERFGLKKSRDLLLYHIDLTKPFAKQLEEKAWQCAASGIRIRPFNRIRTRKELTWWIELFLGTFSDHWGYVPVSSDEVKTRFGIKQLRWFVDSSLFLVAEFKGVPVAYIWSTPDYNQIFQKMHGRLGPFELLRFICTKRKINSGKLHLIGIKKEFRNQNIGSYLNHAILMEMKNRGYVSAEVGWIDEQNAVAHTTIALTGATVYKKHRVFEKDLIAFTIDNKRRANEIES